MGTPEVPAALNLEHSFQELRMTTEPAWAPVDTLVSCESRGPRRAVALCCPPSAAGRWCAFCLRPHGQVIVLSVAATLSCCVTFRQFQTSSAPDDAPKPSPWCAQEVAVQGRPQNRWPQVTLSFCSPGELLQHQPPARSRDTASLPSPTLPRAGPLGGAGGAWTFAPTTSEPGHFSLMRLRRVSCM